METDFTVGKMSPQQFYKEVCRRTKAKISYNKFKEIFGMELEIKEDKPEVKKEEKDNKQKEGNENNSKEEKETKQTIKKEK